MVIVFFSNVLLLLAYVSQISRPVEASQALVSSSRLTIPSLPNGGRCCGQTSKMWSTVCSGAPHSQTEESLRPHFSMDELNRPCYDASKYDGLVHTSDAGIINYVETARLKGVR